MKKITNKPLFIFICFALVCIGSILFFAGYRFSSIWMTIVGYIFFAFGFLALGFSLKQPSQ